MSGFAPPNPVLVAVYLFAEGAALLSLTLVLSVRLSPIAAGVIGIAVFGCAWLAGVVGSLGTTFHIAGLRDVGSIARYIVPTTACGTERSTTSSRTGSSPARLPPSATGLAILLRLVRAVSRIPRLRRVLVRCRARDRHHRFQRKEL